MGSPFSLGGEGGPVVSLPCPVLSPPHTPLIRRLKQFDGEKRQAYGCWLSALWAPDSGAGCSELQDGGGFLTSLLKAASSPPRPRAAPGPHARLHPCPPFISPRGLIAFRGTPSPHWAPLTLLQTQRGSWSCTLHFLFSGGLRTLDKMPRSPGFSTWSDWACVSWGLSLPLPPQASFINAWNPTCLPSILASSSPPCSRQPGHSF